MCVCVCVRACVRVRACLPEWTTVHTGSQAAGEDENKKQDGQAHSKLVVQNIIPRHSDSDRHQDDKESEKQKKHKEKVGPGRTERCSLVGCQVPNETVL